jgi:hypothetical protein
MKSLNTKFLEFDKSRSLFQFFIKISFLDLVPLLVMVLIAVCLGLFTELQDLQPKSVPTDEPNFLVVVLVTPIFETLLLVYFTALASTEIKSQKRASFIGALPLILLHFVNGVENLIVVAFSFFIQASAYLEMRKFDVEFKNRLTFITCIHALHNLLVYGLYQIE